MTVWHIINIAIPVAFMVGIGFFLDHVSKPEVPKEKSPIGDPREKTDA